MCNAMTVITVSNLGFAISWSSKHISTAFDGVL
jgi:hypothetical protein